MNPTPPAAGPAGAPGAVRIPGAPGAVRIIDAHELEQRMSDQNTAARFDREPVLARRFPMLGEPLPQPRLSIELFPPRTGPATEAFFTEVGRLVAVAPDHLTVTSGAGGGDQVEATFQTVSELRARFDVPVAPHITAAALARDQVVPLAERYAALGIDRVVALRGDSADGVGKAYRPRPDGHAYAAELIRSLSSAGRFAIAAGCYPETHPEAADAATDLRHLAAKVEAGATQLITQYCFDTDRVLRFRDACQAAGITVPIVPGVMPIHSFAQIRRFSSMCGASIPAWLAELFHGLDDQPDLARMVATTVAAEQCRRLVAEGFDALHLYALNRADLTLAVCRLLGRCNLHLVPPSMAAAA
ncbi:methylenetetrahydrofolate reductase [Geminicoccus roseus]|uniref:methylenetetrahydrofolate reductase n=1 Tax=Geminicoccus roseus TaxID=404900 RepID=UPI000684CFF3|nr:methylenetetrahydrofolate reductase [Geminicoccus roseus]